MTRRLRATTFLLTALVAIGSAWPTSAQSPSPSVEPSAVPTPGATAVPSVADRPMPAPAGWLLTTTRDGQGGKDRVQVLATSPTGEQRLVATLEDVTRSLEGEPAADRVLGALPVTVDGMLPVLLEWRNDQGEGFPLLHLHDLYSADPQQPVVGAWADTADRELVLQEATSGPDGLISYLAQDVVDGSTAASHTLVLDPLSRRTTQLREPRGAEVRRSDDWLAAGGGWPATQGEATGILTTAGTFRPTTPPLPLVDLARGARQVSTSGRGLGTWDIGQYGTPGPHREPCRKWWTVPETSSKRPTEIWWNRCRETGTLLDIRWDVDGKGVLMLVGKGNRIQLVRRETPRASRVLATIADPKVQAARGDNRQIEVLALAPGPRPKELLLAFRPVDHFGSVFYLSTIEGTVHEVPGDFAGFVEPPVDRDVTDVTPFVLQEPATPDAMVAPADWMLAWIAGSAAAGGSRPLRVVALGPTGEVREVADLPGILDAEHQLVEDATGVMHVTTGGYLPVPVAADPEAAAPSGVLLADLHDPTAAPKVLEDTTDRVHDWLTLRSAPSGRLSVVLADDPFPDLHTIQDLFLPGLDEWLVSYPPTLDVDVDPIRTSDGWPAIDAGHVGILDRTSATFEATQRRLVALARGAEQVTPGGARLWRVVAASARKGGKGCPQGVIRAGATDGTGPVWWNACREDGVLLDIRWDTDGDGALLLVQRGRMVRLLRERRPGRFERVGEFPVPALGLTGPIRGQIGVDALMKGTAAGELLLALSAGGRPWRWSTLSDTPVPLPLDVGEVAGFAGFSVPPGDPR